MLATFEVFHGHKQVRDSGAIAKTAKGGERKARREGTGGVNGECEREGVRERERGDRR